MTLTTRPVANGEREQHQVALAVEHLSKRFGVTHALRDVSLVVRRGEIHGLLGGNGSGKSTLVKVLAGVHHAEPGGVICIGETELLAEKMTPLAARRSGLRFVHQDAATFSTMTVAENIAIGGAEGFPCSAGRIAWTRLRAHTERLLERFEIEARADDTLGDLRPAARTMVAIARALEAGDEEDDLVLVLDEPTASLPEHEVATLLDALRRYAAAGETIIYVSHRLEEVLTIVNSVSVLRDGGLVLTRAADGLTKTVLVEAIVGRPLAPTAQRSPAPPTQSFRLEATRLAGGPLINASFAIESGEIVGIAGLLGSGRSELLRMIFGALAPSAGTLTIGTAPFTPISPAEAMAAGIAYVPEDRAADGAFPDLPVTANLSIAQLERYHVHGRVSTRAERAAAQDAIARFTIRCEDPNAPLASLSGGNQQKVMLARWLTRTPKLLLLDEPTQGVDIGARSDLYELIAGARADGMAVLMVSSDFEELALVCDRVLILREGRIVNCVDGADLSAYTLSHLLHGEQR